MPDAFSTRRKSFGADTSAIGMITGPLDRLVVVREAALVFCDNVVAGRGMLLSPLLHLLKQVDAGDAGRNLGPSALQALDDSPDDIAIVHVGTIAVVGPISFGDTGHVGRSGRDAYHGSAGWHQGGQIAEECPVSGGKFVRASVLRSVSAGLGGGDCRDRIVQSQR